MAGDLDKFIQWFEDREGKVGYSLDAQLRLGPDYYDCSSAIYYALINGGFLSEGTFPGNTDSLYEMEGDLLIPIDRSEAKYGDMFISGVKGNSGGADGHTGTFYSPDQLLHCSPSVGGIGKSPANDEYMGTPNYCYRIKGGANDGGDNGNGDGSDSEYNGGDLNNEGHTLSQNDIRLIIEHAQEYDIKPSFLIAQMFVESHWGDPNTSTVGDVDNNWAGISEPFSVPDDLGINMSRGTARPSNEGGYYVHFETVEDFFKAYTYLLSNRNGIYNVEGTSSIEDYCKGLFRVGGASSDYAASGYDAYYDLLIPTYNALEENNPGKLDEIDNSSSSGGGSNPDPDPDPDPSESSISDVQKWLNSNYDAGLDVDGSFGPASNEAVVRAVQTELNAQHNAGLDVDGSFGPAAQLAWVPLVGGETGNLVYLAQAQIIGAGYDPQGFDGSYGPGMQAAVRQFQTDQGLAADGFVGPTTSYALFNHTKGWHWSWIPNPDVTVVQQWLNATYTSGVEVDGSYGPLARTAAVRAVQTEMNAQYNAGLETDGSFGPASQAAWQPLTQGVTGNITQLVQGHLIGVGYNPQGFDGSFGPGMESAVRQFQTNQGLAVDGSIGPATASTLFNL